MCFQRLQHFLSSNYRFLKEERGHFKKVNQGTVFSRDVASILELARHSRLF
jgi:hypothetical protein